MATIRKRGNKFQAQVRRNGFQGISKSFERLTEAKAWARQIEIGFDRGETPLSEKQKANTFAGIAKRYLKEVSPSKKSYLVEQYRIPNLVHQSFAKIRLYELTSPDIAKFRDSRLKQVSGASVRKELYLISAIIKHANAEWLDRPIKNPVSQVAKPRDSKPRNIRLTDNDRLKLFDAMAKSKHERLKAVISFALETGLRRSEILGLRWSDTDLNRGLIKLHETKNGSSRIVPLSSAAIKIISLQPEVTNQIFPLSANACRLGWERLRVKAKLPHLRFHDLRHEAISRLFELGLTIPEVTMVSGHKTKSQVLRYAHSDLLKIKEKLKSNIMHYGH